MPAGKAEDEHLKLLRDMRDSLRTLPDELVRLLSRGPGGGVFPQGAPAPVRIDAAAGQVDEHKGPPDQLRAVENAGFALGRFVPIFGQLAGLSRDIRAVMEAFSALGKMRAEGTTVAFSGGLGKADAARRQTAAGQQEALKGFNLRPPDWQTQAKLEGKDTTGRLGSPLGPAALKLSNVAQPTQPPPTDAQLGRALNALGRGPKYLEQPPKFPPLPQRGGPSPPTTPGPGGAALFGPPPPRAASLLPPPAPPGLERRLIVPEPRAALPTLPWTKPRRRLKVPVPIAGKDIPRPLAPPAPPAPPPAPFGARAHAAGALGSVPVLKGIPSPFPGAPVEEGFPPSAVGGVPTGGPVLSGGVGQQLLAKLDQLINLATGQRQQQQDDASDTPDDRTRHSEDLKGDSFWQQEKGGARETKGGLHAEALAPPKSGGKGASGMMESIASEVLKAAITAAIVG